MRKSLLAVLLIGPIVGIFAGIHIQSEYLEHGHADVSAVDETAMEHARKHMDPTYVCPMHPEISSKDADATCPICGMDLEPVKQTSMTPAENDGIHPTVTVSPSIMNSLGVKTEKLVRRNLERRVETPGFVQQIKKGKLSHFTAPFDGIIKEYLSTDGDSYKTKGTPLIALESEQLLEAQKKHLEIFNAASQDEKHISGTADAAAEFKDDNDAIRSYLDKDGKIIGEYREKLYAMGHTDKTITKLEEEMQDMMVSFDKTGAGKSAVAGDEEKTAATTASKAENAATDQHNMTLKESRFELRKLGMREIDIDQLEKSGKATNRLVMYANHDGRILDKRFAAGMAVSEGERMFKLGGEVRATVVANAFQRDAAWITTGQRAEITFPHESGVVYPGIVNAGAISINPDSQNIGIRLTFTAPLDKVRSNMYVNGTIFGEGRENAIAVPTQAIIRTEGEDRVIKALGEGRFKPVTVTLGVESGSYTEIVEGLEEGDDVVVMAHFLIDSESSLQASLQRLTSE